MRRLFADLQIALHAYQVHDISQCASVKPMESGSGEDEEVSSESSSGGDDYEDGEKMSLHICQSCLHALGWS